MNIRYNHVKKPYIKEEVTINRPLLMMVVAFIIGELAALIGIRMGVAVIIYLILVLLAVAACYGLFLIGKNIRIWDKVVLICISIALLMGYLAYNAQAEVYERYDRLQYGDADKGNISGEDGEYAVNTDSGDTRSNPRITVVGEVTSIIQKEYGYIVELQTDDGLVWVQLMNVNGIRYGATLSLYGDINPMKNADNPGNYNEREYLHSNGVILKIKVEEDEDGEQDGLADAVKILGDSDDYSFIEESLYMVKRKAIEILRRQCDEKEMGLLSAIVLGEKSYIDEEIKELYSANSIAHVLSISGLHISVIGMGLYGLLRMRLRYLSSAATSAAVMVFFAVMTGNSVSVVRAVIMFVMHVVADVLGRKNDMLSAISLSALVLLWDNPFYITNASFILSYSAMLAVTITAPVVVEFFKTENNIVKTILFNVSLTFTSMPVNMCLFYRISTYSILLNLLVVPLMGLMLSMAIFGMLVSVVSQAIGEACLGTSVYILRFYEWLCRVAEGLPVSSVVTGSMSFEMVLLYYALLALVLLLMANSKGECKKRKLIRSNNVLIAFILIHMLFIVYEQKADGFEMCFLDVGQGDCAYIHSQSGRDYLIDCGSTDEKNVGKYKLESFLEYKDVDCIEYAFISHCDTDHISGIMELIEREDVAINNLVLPIVEKTNPSENGKLLVKLASNYGIDVLYFGKGSNIKDGQLELICVSPAVNSGYVNNSYSQSVYSDINEASMVLFMRYESLVTLFAGDIGIDTEKHILDDISLLIKETERELADKLTIIYKVAHHGSMYSTSTELLDILKPDIAIISCGEDNYYGHPHKETLERLDNVGALVLTTSDCQAVIVEFDGKIVVQSHGKWP